MRERGTMVAVFLSILRAIDSRPRPRLRPSRRAADLLPRSYRGEWLSHKPLSQPV